MTTDEIKKQLDNIQKALGNLQSSRKQKGADAQLIYFKDVNELHKQYMALVRQLHKDATDATPEYLQSIQNSLLLALNGEIARLAAKNKLEFDNFIGELTARDRAKTPRFYRPWYCIFKKVPNRAMQILIDKEALDADEQHDRAEHDNALREIDLEKIEEQLERELRAAKGLPPKSKKVSERKLKRQRAAYDKLRKIFEDADNAPAGDAFKEPQGPKPAALPEPGLPEREELNNTPAAVQDKPTPKQAKKKPAEIIEQLPGQIDIEEIKSPAPKNETADKK